MDSKLKNFWGKPGSHTDPTGIPFGERVKRLPWMLALAVTLTARTPAQEVHLVFDGLGRLWNLSRVAPTGDLDGDGVGDLVLGAFDGWIIANATPGGAVLVVSGADGHLIHIRFGAPGENYGEAVAGVGDFDGDGVPDFASGFTDSLDSISGMVRVWSGAGGELIAKIPGPKGLGLNGRFGDEVFPLGDIDQDGFTELATIAHGCPELYIYGGPDGTLDRITAGGGGEATAASVGDLNQDSVPDYVVGWELGHYPIPGLVMAFSGKTGVVLKRIVGEWTFGRSVAAMGDVDGDGVPDFAAGAPQGTGACDDDPGFSRIFSGQDGSVIRQIDGPSELEWARGCRFKGMHGGQDVNGDGIADLLVESSSYFGDVTVYSGATGTMLWRVWPGRRGALVGDLDGDGLSEFAHGDQDFSDVEELAGRITVYKGAAGDAVRVCTSSPNSTGRAARLDLNGPISVGNNDLELVVTGGVPNQRGLFLYGPQLSPKPFGDGTLCIGGGKIGLKRLGPPVLMDAGGSTTQLLDMTAPPLDSGPKAWTPGRTWYVQFWYRDPKGPGGSGFNLSDAMKITLLP